MFQIDYSTFDSEASTELVHLRKINKSFICCASGCLAFQRYKVSLFPTFVPSTLSDESDPDIAGSHSQKINAP